MRATIIVRPPSIMMAQHMNRDRIVADLNLFYGDVDEAVALPEGMTDEAMTATMDGSGVYLEIATGADFAARAYHPDVVADWGMTPQWLLICGDPRSDEGMAEAARFEPVMLPEDAEPQQVADALVAMIEPRWTM